MVIGILALQGAYQKHAEAFARLGVATRLVREPADLEGLDGLVIPGGESTTMTRLLAANRLWQPLREFGAGHSVMGTCAGAILLAEVVGDARVEPLGLMPLQATRNHYGRQIHSFIAPVELAFGPSPPFEAVFIRAPGLAPLDASVEILARHGDEPVMLAHGRHLALSFHPELTGDDRIHRYWLECCVDDGYGTHENRVLQAT